MSFTEIKNLGQASDMVLRLTHEDDSPHLTSQDVKFWLNESERLLLGQKYYPFLDTTKIFDQSVDTKLGTAITVGDTVIVLTDSSGLATAGTILIDGNFITYTSNDAVQTLSGVTGIAVDRDAGVKVQQVYDLSTDLGISQFSKPISLAVGSVGYKYYDSRAGFNDLGYSIYNGFLVIPYSTSGDTVKFKYEADAGAMTEDTDTFTTPVKYIGVHVQYATYQAKITINDPTYVNNQREYNRLKNMFMAYYGNQTERKDKFLRSPYL